MKAPSYAGETLFLIVTISISVAGFCSLLLMLSFAMIRQPRTHGALLLSTFLLFMGIARVFTLLNFVLAYRIEGPDTFYRFALAASTATGVVLITAIALLIKDYRHGWPYLLVAGFFVLNGVIDLVLAGTGGADRLTQWVGGLNKGLTFGIVFVGVLGVLVSLGVGRGPGHKVRNSAYETAR